MPSSIRTLQAEGVPSSSIVSEPRRSSMVPSSTTVTPWRGDPLAEQAGEGRGLLAVEVALEAVADRLVQQDAGPARRRAPRSSRRRALATESSLTSAWRSASSTMPLPARRLEQAVVAEAAAGAGGGALHARAVADHDADVEPDQRADVAAAHTVRAHDLDLLPGAAQRRAHLPDPRILAAGIGVDLLEQCDLVGLVAAADRVGLAVAAPIGAARRQRQRAAVPGLDRADRRRSRGAAPPRSAPGCGRSRSPRRRPRAGRSPWLVSNAAPLSRPSSKAEALGLAILEEQLAVVDRRAALRRAAPRGAPAPDRSPPTAAGAALTWSLMAGSQGSRLAQRRAR